MIRTRLWPIIVRCSPLVVYVVVLALFVRNRYAAFQFPIDDAWIHRIYSRSFAYGHGFAYNVGQQEAGSSSPFWAIVSAPAQWLEPLGGTSVAGGVKLIGVALCFAAVLFLQQTIIRITKLPLAATVAAILFAIQPRLLFSALSGMENSLLVALWVGAAYAYVNNRHLVALVLLGLMPVSRPEAVLLLPLAGLALLHMVRAKTDVRIIIAGLIALLAPLLLWMAFCRYTNGHLLPNTFYLKTRSVTLEYEQLRLSLEALAQYSVLPKWIIPLGCVIFIYRCGIRYWVVSLLLIVVPVLFAVAVVCSRGFNLNGYYWTRWIDPAALVLNAAAVSGLAFLVVFEIPNRLSIVRWKPVLQYGVGFIGILLIGSSIPNFIQNYVDRRGHMSSDSRAIALMNVRMGQWLNENTDRDDVIGVNDAGAIKYFSNRKTVDLLGLNNAEIAFRKVPKSKAISRVDWLAIFPSWFPKEGANIFRNFRKRHRITIPLKEYTICNCGGQTEMVALQKKRSKR
jgi:arabinofuranosyltransferase